MGEVCRHRPRQRNGWTQARPPSISTTGLLRKSPPCVAHSPSSSTCNSSFVRTAAGRRTSLLLTCLINTRRRRPVRHKANLHATQRPRSCRLEIRAASVGFIGLPCSLPRLHLTNMVRRRRFTLELNFLVVALRDDCTKDSCPVMKATDEWQYLCAAHKTPKEARRERFAWLPLLSCQLTSHVASAVQSTTWCTRWMGQPAC